MPEFLPYLHQTVGMSAADFQQVGVPGVPTPTITGVWRTGVGVPADTLGENGDWYVNSTNKDVYVKAAGAYALEGNLVGTGSSALKAWVVYDYLAKVVRRSSGVTSVTYVGQGVATVLLASAAPDTHYGIQMSSVRGSQPCNGYIDPATLTTTGFNMHVVNQAGVVTDFSDVFIGIYY